MKKMLALILLSLFLIGCTPKDYTNNLADGEESFVTSNYEQALQYFQHAREAKVTDEIDYWITYTEELLKRQTAFNEFEVKKMESLLEENTDLPNWDGKEMIQEHFDNWNQQVKETFKDTSSLDSLFVDLEKNLTKEKFNKVNDQLTEIKEKLAEANKDVYFKSYTEKWDDISKKVKEEKEDYDIKQEKKAEEKRLAKIKKERKEAERKAEEARKNNMYHWSDEELITFMQNHFDGTDNEDLAIFIGDRSETPLPIEVRLDIPPEGMEKGDAYLTANLGFFEIDEAGTLFEIDPTDGVSATVVQ